MRIIIPGQTPAQKNNKQIIPGKPPRLVDNKRVREWRQATAKQLRQDYPDLNFKGQQVEVFYSFFVKDKRPRDDDNMQNSINDALVEAGIIDGDNWQIKRCVGTSVQLDRETPRAEIYVTEGEWLIE